MGLNKISTIQHCLSYVTGCSTYVCEKQSSLITYLVVVQNQLFQARVHFQSAGKGAGSSRSNIVVVQCQCFNSVVRAQQQCNDGGTVVAKIVGIQGQKSQMSVDAQSVC